MNRSSTNGVGKERTRIFTKRRKRVQNQNVWHMACNRLQLYQHRRSDNRTIVRTSQAISAPERFPTWRHWDAKANFQYFLFTFGLLETSHFGRISVNWRKKNVPKLKRFNVFWRMRPRKLLKHTRQYFVYACISCTRCTTCVEWDRDRARVGKSYVARVRSIKRKCSWKMCYEVRCAMCAKWSIGPTSLPTIECSKTANLPPFFCFYLHLCLSLSRPLPLSF